MYQVEEDWKKPFITDIKVIDKDEHCANLSKDLPGEWFDIFEYTWSGMRTVFTIDCLENNFNMDTIDCKQNQFKVEILAN